MFHAIRWCIGLLVICFSLFSHAQNFEAVKRAAERGDAAAQYALGVMIEKNGGNNPDKAAAEAAKWYRKAADQGYANAQVILDAVSALKRAAPLNKDAIQIAPEAVKRLRKLAEQGDAAAQFYLGVVYLDRHNGQDDALEASKWLRKASENGHTVAKNLLDGK